MKDSAGLNQDDNPIAKTTMYEAYFQLQGRPFRTAPCADDYVPTTTMQRSIDQCCNAIRRELGPATMIAAPGMGKTLALNVIARRVQDSLRPVHVFCNRDDSRADLLQNVLFELGQPFRNMSIAELRLTFKAACCRRSDSTQGTLLLLDDADRLSIDVMDELRWISNLSHSGSPLVSIVMAGGLALEETLNHPRLASLNQRIAVRTCLGDLNREETRRYIHGQIERVRGDAAELISDKAIVALHQLSQGCPRIINQICDQAMLLAASANEHRIDEPLVHQAWADIQCLPLDSSPHRLAESSDDLSTTTNDDVEANLEADSFALSDAARQSIGATDCKATESDDDSWEVIEFGTLGDSHEKGDSIETPASALAKEPGDENFQLAEPSDELAASLDESRRFSEAGDLSQPAASGGEAWSVVTPFVDHQFDASGEYRLAPLDDDDPTPAGGPLDDSFEVEFAISDHFCTVVAEQNLNALRVGEEHVDSLNSQLRARLKTGIMKEPESDLPRVVCEPRGDAASAPTATSSTLQIVPESVGADPEVDDSQDVLSGHEDLRLTPEEIAQLESVDKFLNEVEARIRRELRNGPATDSAMAEVVDRREEGVVSDLSDSGIDGAVGASTSVDPLTSIPSESRLVTDEEATHAEDDRDLLVVSHVHRLPDNAAQTPKPSGSTPRTRRDGEVENKVPQGRAIRMDYQDLFRQLKQSQSST